MIDFKYESDFEKSSVAKLISIKSEDNSVNVDTGKIHYEQLEVNHSLCSEEQLTFGCCEASSLKYRTTNDQKSGVGKWINASLTIGGKEDAAFNYGNFKIYSETPTDDKRYKDVVAYDKMYDIINADVAAWYEALEFPMTVKAFRNSFFAHFGATQKATTLVNDGITLQKTITSNQLSGKDVLTSICEINGCFGHIAADGQFEYKTLSNQVENAYSVSIGQRKSLKFEDYEVQKIETVQIRKEENDIGAVYPENSLTSLNAYIIEDNFLTYGMSAEELATVAENFYNAVKDITYVPVELSMQGNPCIDVGDMVKINLKDDAALYTYALEHSISGLQQLTGTITAQGNKYYDQNINGTNRQFMQLRGKTNTLVRTVEETISKITEITEDLTEVSSQIQQVAGKIITEITAGGEVQSRFSQELGKFLFEGKWFAIHTDNITIDGTILEIDNGYIGGLRIGSEGLSSDDYTTLQIFKDGTGRFTNLYGNGQGYIDLTSHHPTDVEKDIESFFRTTDGFHADYDKENNISVGMYVNKDGNATLSRLTGKQKSRTETGVANLVLKKDGAEIVDKDGNLLPIDASNIPKTSFSKIKLVNSTFDASTTSDAFFNKYIKDINHPYDFLDSVQTYADVQGFSMIIASYEADTEVHFLAKSTDPVPKPYARFVQNSTNKKFACMTSDTNQTWYQLPFIDISYDTATGNITHTRYQKPFPFFDPRYESYTTLPASATNFSIYFPKVVESYVIELCSEDDPDVSNHDVYNAYYYVNTDNMLRKNGWSGEVIANVRQGAIENDTISAATTEDAFSLKAGENVNISAVGADNEITISVPITGASSSQAGTMSAADKSKLDGIQAGAEQNVQSDWNVTDTSSDAYIKNKPSSMPASDVPDWAKQPNKPEYTAEEVGADASGTGAIVYDQSKKYADKAVSGAFTKENVTNALGYTPYTQQEVDNKISALETNIDWKESVATYADIATTYPNPDDGWTVNVKDTDYTYRFNGTEWVAISANAIPLATKDVNGLLSAIDKANYDKAYEYSQEAHAPVNAERNTIVGIKKNGTAVAPDSSRVVDITVPTKTSELTNDSGYLKEADIKDLSNKLDKTGDASNTTVAFTQATTRANVTTGEKLSALFGKIAKWFADLKTVAFTGSYSDLLNTPSSLPASDVPGWAKQPTKPAYSVSEIKNDADLGGVNLYLDTKSFKNSTAWKNYASWNNVNMFYNGFTVFARYGAWVGLYQPFSVKKDEVYTISCYAKVTTGGTIGIVRDGSVFSIIASSSELINSKTYPYPCWVIETDDASTEFKRYWVTVKALKDYSSINLRIENSIANKTMYICGLKLEKGYIATEWTPHPADTDADLSEYIQTKYKRTRTTVGDCGWTSYAADGNYIPDIALLSFWNGAYSGTSSNLAYCNKGKFGTIVTKNIEDFSSITGNAATATKLATARSINGASFDGTKDIQLPIYFSYKFGITGNLVKYAVFCKMKKDNLSGEGETTMLLTAHGNFSGTIAGTYLVSISNRGGKVTMRVIALQQENSGQDTTEFGWYSDNNYFYCGVKRHAYSYSENVVVFSKSANFEVGTIIDTSTQPTGWTSVETYKFAKTIDTVSKAYALDSSAGSVTQPVYFKDGKPVACTYSLAKSVPANAVFTDTNTWRDVINNLTSTRTNASLSALQGKILNERIDTVWEKLQAIGGDHIFWEHIGVATSKISSYNGIYVRHGQIVVYSGSFIGKGSTADNQSQQIITGLLAPTLWTAMNVMVNGTDTLQHEAYIDTDGSIYMKNVTNQQVFISGAYICSTE